MACSPLCHHPLCDSDLPSGRCDGAEFLSWALCVPEDPSVVWEGAQGPSLFLESVKFLGVENTGRSPCTSFTGTGMVLRHPDVLALKDFNTIEKKKTSCGLFSQIF